MTIMRMFMITSSLTALSLVAVSTPASAETQSISVPYADLDLTNPAGVVTLEGRIAAAAKRICGRPDARRVHDGADHARCMRETQASVSVEIARLTGRPALALSTRR
jgi:UrcA family protein